MDKIDTINISINKFIKLVIALQLAIWGVLGSEYIGLNLPILREFISCIYLTFIPGIVLLKSIRIDKINIIDYLLYSVGLSISAIMFIGLSINSLYLYLGLSYPLSLFPLVLAISVFVFILCVLIVLTNNSHITIYYEKIVDINSYFILFSFLLVLLSILGSFTSNSLYSKYIFVILLLLITITPLLVQLHNNSGQKLYPLIIFAISLSLLYQNSLNSQIVEWADFTLEYGMAKTIVTNSFWDSTIFNNLNSALSITLLAPIYSIISGMDLVWVFKLIYPLIFSLVPVGIYSLCVKQVPRDAAFLSSLFFIYTFTFFTTMLGLNRQQISELFFVLLFLIIIDKNINKIQKPILSIIFSISIVFSHYAVSCIYLISLIASFIFIFLVSTFGKDKFIAANSAMVNTTRVTLRLRHLLFFLVFVFTWYMCVSGSSMFYAILNIVSQISGNIFSDLLAPSSNQGLELILRNPTNHLALIHKILRLIAQLFIIIGVFLSIIYYRKRNINIEYLVFSFIFLGIVFATIFVPYFGSTINVDRIYHIAILLLSPFLVIGGMKFFIVISRLIGYRAFKPIILISLFLSIYFLFESGLTYEYFGQPISFSLSPDAVDRPHFNQKEVAGIKWLENYKNPPWKIECDLYNAHLVAMYFGYFSPLQGSGKLISQTNAYIFLGKENLQFNKFRLSNPMDARLKYGVIPLGNSTLGDVIQNSNKVFDINEANIYLCY